MWPGEDAGRSIDRILIGFRDSREFGLGLSSGVLLRRSAEICALFLAINLQLGLRREAFPFIL